MQDSLKHQKGSYLLTIIDICYLNYYIDVTKIIKKLAFYPSLRYYRLRHESMGMEVVNV